jgi:DNA repair protein RadC
VLIRDLPSEDRPRERLLKYGAGNLSSAELIAIIWRTGSGRDSALSIAQNALARLGSLAALARDASAA